MPKKVRDNLKEFLTVKNSTDTSADLYFYGDIVSDWWGAWQDEDQYPDAVKNFLAEHKGKALNIHVNSGGGSVFAGITIYNMLKNHNGFKTTYIDGLAASIASIIALAADKVIMGSGTQFMIHKPLTWISGNANDMRECADFLDQIQTGIMQIYKENLKNESDYVIVEAMVNAETWLNNEEASKYFNIEVSNSFSAQACVSNCFEDYNKTPKCLIKPTVSNKNEEDKNKLLMEIDLI